MNSDYFYVVLILGSNFQRSKNFKKGIKLIEKKYKLLKISRIYKSDDTTQKGRFYWNLALLLKMKKTVDLKYELVEIEKECGRQWDSMKKTIALDIDIALVYLFQTNSAECNILAKNIDESLYSFLSLQDILPKKINIKKMFSDKCELVSQVKHRKINLVSILEISNGNRDVL